jgi:hypothetical protein
MATRGLVVAPPRAGVTELVGRINAIPQPTLRGKPRKPPRGARVVADDRLIAEDQPRAAEGSPPWLHDLPEPGSPLIEFALAYARAGLEIMPRRPGAGGRLIDALPGTPRTGLVGEAEVAAYWRARPATPALAVVCGPTSNVLVVDVDQHPGQADGLVTLRELERRHRPLPAPPMVLSPTGAGRHVYFAWPAAPVRFGRLAPGIECVACATRPPSRKRAGRYRWSLSRQAHGRGWGERRLQQGRAGARDAAAVRGRAHSRLASPLAARQPASGARHRKGRGAAVKWTGCVKPLRHGLAPQRCGRHGSTPFGGRGGGGARCAKGASRHASKLRPEL